MADGLLQVTLLVLEAEVDIFFGDAFNDVR